MYYIIVYRILQIYFSTICNIVSQPNRPTEKKLSIVRPTCSVFYGACIKKFNLFNNFYMTDFLQWLHLCKLLISMFLLANCFAKIHLCIEKQKLLTIIEVNLKRKKRWTKSQKSIQEKSLPTHLSENSPSSMVNNSSKTLSVQPVAKFHSGQ